MPNEVVNKIFDLRSFVESNAERCKVIISILTIRVDNQECRIIVRNENDILKELNIPVVQKWQHY